MAIEAPRVVLFSVLIVSSAVASGNVTTPSELCANSDESCADATGVCYYPQICPIRYQEFGNESIMWQSTSDNSTSSTPLCLDEKFEVMHRTCDDGIWGDEPDCASTQKNLSLCPDGFNYFNESNVCYIITEPGPFSPECPFPDVIGFSHYIYFILNYGLIDEPFWVPVKRNISDGFGRFQWLEATSYYGDEFSEHYVYSGSILDKNCLIYRSEYEAVSCNETYRSVCAYNILQSYSSTYCQQNFPEFHCVPRYFEPSYECSCVQNVGTCEKYAGFELPYQNFFPRDRSCYMGLEKTSNGTFIWPSQKEITYSFWSKNTAFNNTHGAVQNWSGWTLEKDGLDCVICEVEITPKTPNITLEYLDLTRRIFLKVYFTEHLKHISLLGYGFKCFTDTGVQNFHMAYPQFDIYSFEYFGDYYVYVFTPNYEGPGCYWCEGFQYPDLTLVRSNVIFINDRNTYGNEFSVLLTIPYSSTEDPSKICARDRLYFALEDSDFTKMIYNIRDMKVLYIDDTNNNVQSLVHITAKIDVTIDREAEYEIFYNNLMDVASNESVNFTVDQFTSSTFCYKTESIISDDLTLHWPTTDINEEASSDELCLREDGTTAVRKCVDDFLRGAQWEDFTETCLQDLGPHSSVTDDLVNLLSSEENSDVILEELSKLSEKYEEFQAIDVHLTGQILGNFIDSSNLSLECLVHIVNNVIEADREVLTRSQRILNATDNILFNYDMIIQNSDILDAQSVVEIYQNNMFLMMAHLDTNISGIALFLADNNTLQTESLFRNSSIDAVLDMEGAIAAAVLPDQLLEQINVATNGHSKLIVTLFFNDSLFNSRTEINVTDISKIFGVLIPGFEEPFVAPVNIFFRHTNYEDFNRTCAFWSYKVGVPSKTGSKWKPDNGVSILEEHRDFSSCEFWHVTHFALLILDDLRFLSDLPESVFNSLELITTINCSLSLFGVACIMITGLLFKSWRRNTGNRVLINFISAIALQILLLFTSGYMSDSDVLCTIGGALLHYAVISEFCWMLVIAILQFKRFVQVFGGPPRAVLLKACAVGWLLPALPVTILLAVDTNNYSTNYLGFCYPSGLGLYLGILLPLGIILSANITIYIIILSDIFFKKTDTSHCLNSELIFQWRLVVLLFFMLGLTWSFGILAYMYELLIFVYIFVFTSSLQGFMLFLFFIVFNNSTRMLYVRCFKNICRMY